MLYLGVDLGGTNIKAAVTDADGHILYEASVPTRLPRTAEKVCDDIAALCQKLLREASQPDAKIGAIGIGCPGTVDGDTGTVLYSNNLNWHNFAMGHYLAQALHLPVFLGNDANVAAFGEAMAGCAKGAQSAVILTLGTGVGGGVILDGKMLTGYTGAASEPGHIVVESNGAPCTCGKRGCLEAYASATALIRMTREAAQANPGSMLARGIAPGDITGRTAFDFAQAGDKIAQAVVDRYIGYLAIGVSDLINLFFPEVVGFSGGVANQGEKLLAPLRKAVEPMVFGHSYALKKTRLVSCTLGYHAGVIGAALLAANLFSSSKDTF